MGRLWPWWRMFVCSKLIFKLTERLRAGGDPWRTSHHVQFVCHFKDTLVLLTLTLVLEPEAAGICAGGWPFTPLCCPRGCTFPGSWRRIPSVHLRRSGPCFSPRGTPDRTVCVQGSPLSSSLSLALHEAISSVMLLDTQGRAWWGRQKARKPN